jgi:SSS family transporter
MVLTSLDYAILIGFFIVSITIGIVVAKQSGKNTESFFLSGRNMPWWLLGISMVATTFAADTPNFVAGVIREDGVYGNWIWWSFLLTGMVTVFFYSKLWRKSGITTDLEFYELRYSGKSAAFLRGFRAIYLGIFFNIVIMANVCLAAIKIGHVMFGFSEFQSLFIACGVTVFYSMLGGLRGVLLTDFVQFIIAMTGSIWAAVYIVNHEKVGGLTNMLAAPELEGKLSMFPDFNNWEVVVPLLIIPLAVQWWSVWYPGAEPGGGGYIAQRMLAAKNEKHATWATLFFNFAHYGLRPWPWIIIGLASLIVYPDLVSLQAAFPEFNPDYVKNDLSYPAMLRLLPAGLMGLVVTSLVAAFMSTISTHLNWGSSYVVNDFYARFIKKDASEKKKVLVGRISTFLMIICAALLALILEEARQAFNLLLQIGAGTGLLFIMRWFWRRINPYSEITAMAVSFIIAVFFFLNDRMDTPLIVLETHWQLVLGVIVTTLSWVAVTFATKPSKITTIEAFEALVFEKESKFKNFRFKFLALIMGILGVYCFLFATGFYIYGNTIVALVLTAITLICIGVLVRIKDKF